MVEESDAPDREGGAGDDGVAAVLYGMFTSFTEALDGFDRRLESIESSLRAGPGETAERLRAVESALAAAGAGPAPGGGVESAMAALREAVDGWASGVDAALTGVRTAVDDRASDVEGAVAAHVAALGEALEARTAAVQGSVDELRALLLAHVDDTSHSLGRRAGEVGRRLAADLGLRPRPRSGAGPPGSA